MFKFINRLRSVFKTTNASYSLGGQLHIPAVDIMVGGRKKTCEVTMRIISEEPLQFEVESIIPPLSDNGSPSSTAAAQPRTASFICNVCGKKNKDVALETVRDREAPSCSSCGSSLRMRSLIHALSQALFDKDLSLPDFPEDKGICGIGMSDWNGYAIPLAEKLGYTNTFYHTEPHLDIMNITHDQEGKFDFIISSDVFEHILPPVSIAFENTFKLLKPGGAFILTVPFTQVGQTVEHFPNLHDYRIEDKKKWFPCLVNTTETGDKEQFKDLIFHGGDGFTLEMRMFSEQGLMDELTAAGFTEIHVQQENHPESSIIWPITWAVPIIAKRPC
ncbi:MAG: methyltransferase domain-containing protein [Desulfobacterium sp.]|nr:methyltransferase domain-containing protein [Desulfobacterium sp.]